MAAVRAALRQARERLDEAVAVAAASAPAPEAERGSEQWVDNQVTLSRLLAAQGAVRNAGTDLGAIMAKLAEARVGGAATTEAEAEVQALQAEVEALLTRGQSEIGRRTRSEEHTSELQTLMRISYAVFCLKKKKNITNK